jgi:hypothetical protein
LFVLNLISDSDLFVRLFGRVRFTEKIVDRSTYSRETFIQRIFEMKLAYRLGLAIVVFFQCACQRMSTEYAGIEEAPEGSPQYNQKLDLNKPLPEPKAAPK